MPRVLLLVIARIVLAGAACLAFAGCSSLSGIGPSAGDVVEEAGPGAAPRYELVDIDSNVVETLRQRGPNSFLAHFGDYRPSVEPRIGIGDTVMVTIWEAGAGGLFSAPVAADHFSTGSKSATIPDQVVGRDGAITVPYAGQSLSPGARPETCRPSSNMRSKVKPSNRKSWSMSSTRSAITSRSPAKS